MLVQSILLLGGLFGAKKLGKVISNAIKNKHYFPKVYKDKEYTYEDTCQNVKKYFGNFKALRETIVETLKSCTNKIIEKENTAYLKIGKKDENDQNLYAIFSKVVMPKRKLFFKKKGVNSGWFLTSIQNQNYIDDINSGKIILLNAPIDLSKELEDGSIELAEDSVHISTKKIVTPKSINNDSDDDDDYVFIANVSDDKLYDPVDKVSIKINR